MKITDFAKYMSTFLGTYLPGVRNVSINTIRSYRDTYRLLLIYCKNQLHIQVEKVSLSILTDKLILAFLDWLQGERNSSFSTRNQRLAAIHAFFRYVQIEEPVLLTTCQRILGIPFKRHQKPVISHLTPDALKLILEQPDKNTLIGRRNLTILSVLYDTGARVQELVDLRVRDIRLDDPAVVLLTGKGRKSRYVPLLRNTVLLLTKYMQEKKLLQDGNSDKPLFFNHQHNKMTRAGISYILKKYSTLAQIKSKIIPDNITPHVFRHTKAMHMYQAGVNLVYIRDLLGHVDISTTEIYAKADTEMKRKALEKAYPDITSVPLPDWNHDQDLLSWLKRF